MGRKSPSPEGWPAFDEPLLREVAEAFLRRRKALAYQAHLSCARAFAQSGGGIWERLDLARSSLLGRYIQLSVWADGSLWVSVRVRGRGRNAGWSFADTFTGSALDVAPATLVGMLEATVALALGPDPTTEQERLRSVWARVLSQAG